MVGIKKALIIGSTVIDKDSIAPFHFKLNESSTVVPPQPQTSPKIIMNYTQSGGIISATLGPDDTPTNPFDFSAAGLFDTVQFDEVLWTWDLESFGGFIQFGSGTDVLDDSTIQLASGVTWFDGAGMRGQVSAYIPSLDITLSINPTIEPF